MIRVLFYTSTPRSFQTTLIGNLYELSQVYPVILLAEELNATTREVLQNKALFPKLEKIIPVEQYTGKKRGRLMKYCYVFRTAKRVVKEYQPSIVITANDVYPFEMYLMRFAKKLRAVNVCFQPSLQMNDRKGEVAWWVLRNVHSRYPRFFPLRQSLVVEKWKKILGYVLYYWILPLTVGQKPFWGKSSFLDWHAGLTPQMCDHQIVLSARDYAVYKGNGFPAERLHIVSHPLERKARGIFEKIHSSKASLNPYKERRVVTVMWPEEIISFQRSDRSVIPKEKLARQRIRAVTLLSQILGDWKIFIKPHPALKDDKNRLEEIRSTLTPISSAIKITKPEEAAETYIEMSDLVVGFPPASTTIFIASLWHPEKPILSLNLQHELLGDFYEDVDGVEYIDTEEKLLAVLKSIRDDRYQKKQKDKEEITEKEFSSTVEAVETLYAQTNIS